MERKRLLAALVALFLVPQAVSADAVETAMQPPLMVDVGLMLAVDVSASVDAEERRFQRAAYARALSDPLVIRAALGGRSGRIALGYMEWSGPRYQRLLLAPRIMETADDMRTFAAAIAELADRLQVDTASDVYDGTTAMGNALLRASEALDALEVNAQAWVIDISADGLNNDGAYVDGVRDDLIARGFVINGLPIAVSAAGADPSRNALAEQRLEQYFTECVVGGVGAFHIVARGWSDVETALRAKLILELAGFAPRQRRRLAAILSGTGVETSRVRPVGFRIDMKNGSAGAEPPFDCAAGRLNSRVGFQ